MKNATKHADELKSLHKRLARDYEPAARPTYEPLVALVRGALSFDVPDSKVDAAMAAIEREFVDLNELRVATDLEVEALLGERYPQIGKRVALMSAIMNDIFEKEHTLSLDRLRALKKADARQFLRDLAEMTPFVEAYVMLYAFDGHAYPIDAETHGFLTEQAGLPDDAAAGDVQKLIESAFKAEDLHEFYAIARAAAFDAAKARRKAARA